MNSGSAWAAWRFGDLVDRWAPINEPMVVATNGYVNIPGVVSGNFPPGVYSFTAAVTAIRNLEAANSVAYAAAEDLEGRFTDTPRDRFWMALDVSAYSLVACAREAEPLMEAAGGGSIVTMTYLGGERAVPHYNVMGVAKATLDASMRYLSWDLGQKNIRINAVSAGPVRTLAARSIAGFPTMEAIVEERSPLHRHIDADDVAGASAYLLSDDAKNVTGTTLYVDSGYHAMGM